MKETLKQYCNCSCSQSCSFIPAAAQSLQVKPICKDFCASIAPGTNKVQKRRPTEAP